MNLGFMHVDTTVSTWADYRKKLPYPADFLYGTICGRLQMFIGRRMSIPGGNQGWHTIFLRARFHTDGKIHHVSWQVSPKPTNTIVD
jgi:hypothetical protein